MTSRKTSAAVLVVDDSKTARRAMMGALACREDKVIPIEVESLDDLAGWLREIQPDLVVLDLVLGDREDATGALRQLSKLDNPPMVVLKTATIDDDGWARLFSGPTMQIVRALAERTLPGVRIESWYETGPESLEQLRDLVWSMLDLPKTNPAGVHARRGLKGRMP